MTKLPTAPLPILAAGLVLSLAACLPQAPRHLHTLYLPAPAAVPSGLPQVRVRLPDYLDRRQVLRRSADGELRLYEGHAWGERLGDGMERLLQEQIAAQLPAGLASPSLLVRVEFSRFEVEPDGVLRVRGQWHAQRRGETLPVHGSLGYDAAVDADSAPAVVQAMGAALIEIAGQISPHLPSLGAGAR